MKRNSALFWALIAAAGTAASADVFIWSGVDGDWENDSLWFGPVGQYPDSIADTATLSGASADVVLNANTSIGGLSILNGLSLYTFEHSLFVNGDVQLTGSGSTLVLRPSPALRDLDVDTMTMDNNAFFILADGLAQFDEALSIQGQSGVLGVGVIEMNSTTGDLDIVSGAIWAQETGTDLETLTVQRTQSSTSRLNWTHPGSGLIVWDDKTMDIQIPFSGALGGKLSVAGGSDFQCVSPIVAGSGSELRFSSGSGAGAGSSTISAPNAIDAYGKIIVSGHATLETPLLVLRGTGEIAPDGLLLINSTAVVLDSFTTSPIDGGGIEFSSGTSNLSVTGGITRIDTSVGGHFDLDGFGNLAVSISNGSSLVLDTQFIERFSSNIFDSTLDIRGTLDIKTVVPGDGWTNSGEITLDGGTINGRNLVNETTIQGKGTINATVYNNGTLIADGGSLYFDYVDLDGNNASETGTVRAETGDISISLVSDLTTQVFSGSMFVGDGQGAREVLEMNTGFAVISEEGATGSLSLNSGWLRAKYVVLASEFDTRGTSYIRASGNEIFDKIRFWPTGTNTISGTLELDGDTVIREDATFEGEGMIKGVNTNHTIDLANGASTSDIGIIALGGVSLDDSANGIGHATIASLAMAPTASLKIDLAGDNGGLDHDLLTVLDDAIIAGTIELGAVEGFSPAFGDVFTVLTAQSVTGSFSDIDISGLAIGQSAEVTVYATRVDVMVSCRADMFTDGLLDVFDVFAFLDAFQIQDQDADFDNNGVFDIFDVFAFLGAFSAGCS